MNTKDQVAASPPCSSPDLNAEPYISKLEVARLLGRTTRSVENLMRRGIIPYYKVGWRVAFRWSEIQEHLAERYRVCRR